LANILEIDDKGFVTFEVINRSTFQEAETTATQVYAILKEIYHIHTHHHKDTDMLLRPIHITSQDAKPYDKILNEYEEKIISYHNEINKNNIFGIKNFLININKVYKEKEIEKLKKAHGEMLYALNFLNLVDEESFQNRKLVFENAKSSFESLLNTYNSKLSILNNFLVLMTLLATVMLAFSPIQNQKLSIFIFLGIIIMIVFIMNIFDIFDIFNMLYIWNKRLKKRS
jgi:membrane-bound ClpP family serine protease